MSGFIKADAGKLRMDLLPPKALAEVAKVLGVGAVKYAPNNWIKCDAWSRYFAALQRHLNAWHAGEDCDSDDGLPHLSHAACCLLFLMEMERLGVGLDDRPKDDALRAMAKPKE